MRTSPAPNSKARAPTQMATDDGATPQSSM
jgi:hypothetical protein